MKTRQAPLFCQLLTFSLPTDDGQNAANPSATKSFLPEATKKNAFQADYDLKHFASGVNNRQNNLRTSTALVLS